MLLLIEVLRAHQGPNPSVWKKTAQFYKLNLLDILLRYLSEIIGLKNWYKEKKNENENDTPATEAAPPAGLVLDSSTLGACPGPSTPCQQADL